MKSNFTFAAIKEKEKMFFLIFLTKKRNKKYKYEYKNQKGLLQLIDTMSRLVSVAFEKTEIYRVSADTSGTYTKSHFQDLKLR